MYVHALHTVHALTDLRIAAGRLRDGVSVTPISAHVVGHRTNLSNCFFKLPEIGSPGR